MVAFILTRKGKTVIPLHSLSKLQGKLNTRNKYLTRNIRPLVFWEVCRMSNNCVGNIVLGAQRSLGKSTYVQMSRVQVRMSYHLHSEVRKKKELSKLGLKISRMSFKSVFRSTN